MVLYRTTVAAIVTSWSKDPFAHGYVVISLALYLVWQRKAHLKEITPTIGYLGLPVIALFASLWLVGGVADTGLLQQVSLVGLMVGFVWLILGWPAARLLTFPLGCLFFALPLGYRLVPVLEDLAARGAVKLLAFSGVPVLLQAHVISIPGSTWKVADACSGINYLTASLAVGYVYAGTAYRYWLHRIGFILAAALVPLLGNILRIYGTIFLGSKMGLDAVAGTRHFLVGWVVFGLMMALLFFTCGGWREKSDETRTFRVPKPERRLTRARAVCTALGLLIAAAAPFSTYSEGRAIGGNTVATAPTVSLPWTPTDSNRYSWKPQFEKPDSEFVQSYESGKRVVKMFVAFYSGSHPRANLTGIDSALVHEPWWITSQDRRTVAMQGQSVTVRETLVEGPSRSLLLWNWYSIGGTVANSENLARLYLAKAGLFGGSRESIAIAIATESRPGLQAQTVLQDFVLHLTPAPTPRHVGVEHADNGHSD